MKKITQFLLFVAFAFSGFAQEYTYIDFGINTQETEGNWNNVSIQNAASTAGLTVDLIDSNGASTGVTLVIDDEFNTVNTAGTTTPDAALPFPDTATRDSFFGSTTTFQNSLEPTGGFTLSGLDMTKFYSFSVFASRNGVNDNREALYTITGSTTKTGTLDSANNTTNTADVLDVQPNASGVITFRAEPGSNNTNGSGFYYLGAIELITSDMPLAVGEFNFNNSLIVTNPVKDHCEIRFNLQNSAFLNASIYDVNGRLISTLFNAETAAGNISINWDLTNSENIASGLYILKIKANGNSATTKLIIQ